MIVHCSQCVPSPISISRLKKEKKFLTRFISSALSEKSFCSLARLLLSKDRLSHHHARDTSSFDSGCPCEVIPSSVARGRYVGRRKVRTTVCTASGRHNRQIGDPCFCVLESLLNNFTAPPRAVKRRFRWWTMDKEQGLRAESGEQRPSKELHCTPGEQERENTSDQSLLRGEFRCQLTDICFCFKSSLHHQGNIFRFELLLH